MASPIEIKAFWEDEDKRWLIGVAGQYGRDKSRRATGFDDETGLNIFSF